MPEPTKSDALAAIDKRLYSIAVQVAEDLNFDNLDDAEKQMKKVGDVIDKLGRLREVVSRGHDNGNTY